MYPQPELNRLAAHKVALRRGIALRRAQSAEAAARIAQPFDRLDRMLSFWRRLSPLVKVAAVPLGFLAARTVLPQRRILGSLLRWSPLVFGAVHGVRSAFKAPHRDS
ncbi:MAG TPA: hypothetical protein VNW23_06620 [Opitutaceae bacterium]|nr:hypothetical protein [Opitutaceae bacterium]